VIKVAFLFSALSLTPSIALADGPTAGSNHQRVINVTTDSAPHWLPSEALEIEATTTLQKYFRAFDKSDDRAVWNLTTAGLQGTTTFSEFEAGNKKSRADLGRLKHLAVLKVTWTKDPSAAPAPGIYVAIDVAGTFSKTQRHCGYIVFFKSTPTDLFKVARIESNFMSDASAQKIAKENSPAEVTRLWSMLAANCPNYRNPAGAAR
jgi:hypothetical protein